MSKDLPDFLGGEPLSEAAPAAEGAIAETSAAEPAAPAETPDPEAAPAAESPARGPDGKFTAAEEPAPAAPAAEPAPAPAPAAPVADPAHHVPLPVALDWRDRMTAAEKEARELKEWRAQQEARTHRQAQVPDPATDPEGHQQWQMDQRVNQIVAGQQASMRLEFSRQFAEVRHTPEVVAEAYAWGETRCDQDPFFNAKVAASRDPVGFVVQEWKQQQLLSQMTPEKLEAFQKWEAAQAAAPAPAAPVPATPQLTAAGPPAAPAAPRPSLAAAPSAGGIGAPAVGDAADVFAGMFSK